MMQCVMNGEGGTMERFYKDKRIVITGASSGIGRDLALLFASYGAHIAIVARRKDALETLRDECARHGVDVLVFGADVADERAMLAMRDAALAAWPHVDIVIGNAGVGGLNPGTDFSLEVHRKVVETNCLGLANTLVPFIPSMLARRSGHLVGVSSLAAFRGLPNAASYSSTKAQQRIFLESLRVDLRPHGIAVSSIHPGFIETPMTDHDEFRMPFMVPVRKSSLLIARAIRCRKAAYLYPWPMRLLVTLNRMLPTCLYDRIVPRVSGQKSKVVARIF